MQHGEQPSAPALASQLFLHHRGVVALIRRQVIRYLLCGLNFYFYGLKLAFKTVPEEQEQS